jgi:transposase
VTTKPKTKTKKPRRPRSTLTSLHHLDSDLALLVRSIVHDGAAALKAFMVELLAKKLDPEAAETVAKLIKDLATVLGNVRRHDDALNAAGRKLPPHLIVAALRQMAPEERAQLMAEASGDVNAGSVLS